MARQCLRCLEGTGFWFLFPSFAVGAVADDPQYDNVVPDNVNLKEFTFNSMHSSPIGLNVDRGSGSEVDEGAVGETFRKGDNDNPPAEPQFANYTGYKHNVAVYHSGNIVICEYR